MEKRGRGREITVKVTVMVADIERKVFFQCPGPQKNE